MDEGKEQTSCREEQGPAPLAAVGKKEDRTVEEEQVMADEEKGSSEGCAWAWWRDGKRWMMASECRGRWSRGEAAMMGGRSAIRRAWA